MPCARTVTCARAGAGRAAAADRGLPAPHLRTPRPGGGWRDEAHPPGVWNNPARGRGKWHFQCMFACAARLCSAVLRLASLSGERPPPGDPSARARTQGAARFQAPLASLAPTLTDGRVHPNCDAVIHFCSATSSVPTWSVRRRAAARPAAVAATKVAAGMSSARAALPTPKT